jgi:hypothetical protein
MGEQRIKEGGTGDWIKEEERIRRGEGREDPEGQGGDRWREGGENERKKKS